MSVSNIFLYIDSRCSLDQAELEERTFINAGYSRVNVCKADSILELAANMNSGACIVVYSVKCFVSSDELLAILQLFQERGLVIRSLSEPWINLPIIEYLQNLLRIKQLSDYIYDDWINKTKFN